MNEEPINVSIKPRNIPAVPRVAIRVGIPNPAIAIAFTPPSRVPITIAKTIGIKRLSPSSSNFCMMTTAV